MIEMQPRARPHFQPPRERLAVLLAQLSELDPESRKLKLEPVPGRMPDKGLKVEAAPGRKPKLEPRAEPERKLRAQPARPSKPAPRTRPAQKKRAAKQEKPDQPVGSFQNILRSCLQKQSVSMPLRSTEPVHRPSAKLNPAGILGGMANAWSWLQSKYSKTTNKRLRLTEVVSLGEKRFVALVRVEDCEFLIGGAASGLSVLAQLGKTSISAVDQQPGMDAEGHAH